MTVEATSRHARRDTAILVTTLVAAQAFMSFTEALPGDSLARQQYDLEMVASDKCLDQTAYDPAQGAQIPESSNETGDQVLSIEPANSAANLPVLQLLFQEQTNDGVTTFFTPLDNATASVLQEYCAYSSSY